MNRERLQANIEDLKAGMPSFVLEYYQSKRSVPYSLTTLYEYLKEYQRFFTWLISNQEVTARQVKEISLEDLESLSKKTLEAFISYLQERPRLNTRSMHQGVSQRTINRTISALSSLYKYLTEEVEDQHGEPYFYRNVMKKIATKKQRETLASRAENIKRKLFLGDETDQFLQFINETYETRLSPRALSSFKKNKARDMAMIALLLASGIRLSELVNMDYRDLSLKGKLVEVTRKGGKRDAVNIAGFAVPYLEAYLAIRSHYYHVADGQGPLFVSLYRGQARRIDASSVEKLVAKYSESFKVRVTPHKLRHTLATRLYAQTNSQVLVSHQLGHASTQVTDLYTHIVDDEQKNALDQL